MEGYVEDPEEGRSAFTANGALRTSDLGRVDEEGFLLVRLGVPPQAGTFLLHASVRTLVMQGATVTGIANPGRWVMPRLPDERIGAVMLLLACATAPVGRELTEKTFDFQSYSVAAPEGAGWGLVKLDRARRKVAFERATVAVLAGYVSASTHITVFEVPIAPAGWAVNEEEHADRYRDNELQVMNEEGVQKGQYQLRNVRRSVEMVAGLKVYSLRYEAVVGNWFSGGKESASVLYLYFPPDLAERHAFYGFLITAATLKGSIYSTSPDLKQIDPVIASFRLCPGLPSPLLATQAPCVKWTSTCTVRCTDGTTHSMAVAPCLGETPTASACTYGSAGNYALACPGPNASFQDCGDCTPWRREQ